MLLYVAPMRVAFLFNHCDIHQVPHAAPFAFALSRRPGVEVDVLASCGAQEGLARRLGEVHPGGHRARFRCLDAPPWAEAVSRAAAPWVSARKAFVLRANRERLAGYDAVVSPEKTSQRALDAAPGQGPEFILVLHGAGDRWVRSEIGGAGCRLTLVAGAKQAERFSRLPAAQGRRFAAVGSAKLAAVRALTPRPPRLFPNDRPTVLYNPHFCADVSSWQRMGRDVLDWFRDQSDFNLVFAPHVVMFRRARRHKAALPRWAAPGSGRLPAHIHIDTGSAASCDMSYTRAADIYLGDASSQVYEFLHASGGAGAPCVFLDAHNTDWRDSPHHLHWNFGRVARDIPAMAEALHGARATLPLFQPAQRAALLRTYAPCDGVGAVAERGAEAIHAHMLAVLARENEVRHPAAGEPPRVSAKAV